MATRRTSTKDYEAIARARIRDPSDAGPRRILVYSRNKKGKTKFCLTAPKVLILDPENGTDPYIEVAKRMGAKIWPINHWEDVDEAYRYLRLGTHSYEWIAVDGCTRIHRMGLRFVMMQAMERDLDRRPDQIDKRDYGRAGAMMEQMFHNFSSLPTGVIFTAQERMQEVGATGEEDEESEGGSVMWVPDLPKGARISVESIVDLIGRIYVVKTEVKLKSKADPSKTATKVMNQRRMWLEPHPSYDTGYRSEYTLPDYIRNPTVPRLVQLIKEGPKTNG